jgi:PAS domain S-box-containing protein
MRSLVAVPDAASFAAPLPAIAKATACDAHAEKAPRVAGVGIWHYDYALDGVAWSEEQFRIFGVSADTFQPTFANFLELVHPDDREAMLAANREAAFGKPMNFEHRIVRPGGEVRHVHELAQTVIRDALGGHPVLIGTTQDITWRKETNANAAAQEAARTQLHPVQLARRLYKARRTRERFFPPDLFSEPGWDLLLDLYVAHHEARTVTTLSACIAANVPSSTGLRWVEKLEAMALIARSPCATDGRLALVELSADTIAQMTDLLIQIALLLPFEPAPPRPKIPAPAAPGPA